MCIFIFETELEILNDFKGIISDWGKEAGQQSESSFSTAFSDVVELYPAPSKEYGQEWFWLWRKDI